MRLGPDERLAARDDEKVRLPRSAGPRCEIARAVLILPPAARRLKRKLRLLIRQRRPRPDERVRRSEKQVDVDPVVGGDEARDVGIPDEL
jgi:hypothetical protein